MSANSYDVLDEDRPIPLGRPLAPAARMEPQPAVEPQPVVRVPHVEAEPPSLAVPTAAGPAPEVVPPMVPVMVVPPVSPTSPPVGSRPSADPPGRSDGHPLAGLRGLRLEPILVEPTYSWRRDVGRFLVHYALVMAFVYALIVAFVLLVAHVRGTPA